MKRQACLLLATLLCLLSGCMRTGEEAPPPPQAADVPPAAAPGPAEDPIALGQLTVEIVTDWGEADRLLGELDRLSRLLESGLLERGYAPEGISVTISTAGGLTGGALAAGGVDAALLPAEDYVAVEDRAVALLAVERDGWNGIAAAGTGREELDEEFREALAGALAEGSFLEACCPGAAWGPVDEAVLRDLREAAEADYGA